MEDRPHLPVQFLAAVVVALLAPACESAEPCPAGTCVDDGGHGQDVRRPDAIPLDGPEVEALVALEILPREATVVHRDASATQDFALRGRLPGGAVVTLPVAAWTVDRPELGSLDPWTGRFTTNGMVAGITRVHASVARRTGPTLTAEATLTVRVERDFLVPPTTSAAVARFAGARVTDAAREARVLYPLAGAVMPQNVFPPDVQWERGAAGDVFRVRVERPHVVVTAYVTHGVGGRLDWPVDRAAWRTIAESDVADPVRLTVDRFDGRDVVAGTPVEVTLARGSLAGAVYYWDLRAGKILRIADGDARREDFLPAPPRRASDGSRCVACHTVSHDGRYLAAELWEGQGPSAVFDLTTDLSRDPAPTLFDPARASWVYASFNPDGTRLVANLLGGLFLVDPRTGDRVAPTSGTLPGGNAVQPSWSPDGRSIAFVANFVGAGPSAFSQGDLAVLPVGSGDGFGTASVVHRGADLAGDEPAGRADAYPSWSPDSRWIVFQHGPYSESDQDGAPPRYPAALYLIAPTGGAPTRLTRASGAGAQADAFFPNFSPFIQGGAYWLVFFSRRDYGNALAGTQGTGRRQLWVTALDTSATAGSDPSHVPYWLPGQDVAADNLSGFWAPQPCRPRGAPCSVSTECCSGVCAPDAGGMLVCNPPPPDAPCRRAGERCGATGDCCMGLECAANVCLLPPG